MANMGYVRFENTACDLRDCQEALEQMTTEDGTKLSCSELRAAKDLAKTCKNILCLLGEKIGERVQELCDDDSAIDAAIDALNDDCD